MFIVCALIVLFGIFLPIRASAGDEPPIKPAQQATSAPELPEAHAFQQYNFKVYLPIAMNQRFYAHSWYINKADWDSMWNLGYADAIRDTAACTGPSQVDSLVVLAFGQVGNEGGPTYGGYGTYIFAPGLPFVSDSIIENAAKAYAAAWFANTSTCPRLKMVIGTSNYNQCPFGGNCNPTDAGRQWGNLLNNIDNWLTTTNRRWQILVWAGSDMEQPSQYPDPLPGDLWDCKQKTRQFVDGFSSNNPALVRLVNFGTAYVPKPADGSCWNAGDVYYVSWVGYSWPLPEIYHGIAADSWVNIRKQYYMNFMGVMTECKQDDTIGGDFCAPPKQAEYTPNRALFEFMNRLNNNGVGQSTLDYATNIRDQP